MMLLRRRGKSTAWHSKPAVSSGQKHETHREREAPPSLPLYCHTNKMSETRQDAPANKAYPSLRVFSEQRGCVHPHTVGKEGVEVRRIKCMTL